MSTARLTYGDISEFLQAHGFVRTVVPRSHVVFEHRPSGASVMFRVLRSNKRAHPLHVGMVRRTLVDFGILNEKAADEWAYGMTPQAA